MNVITAKTAGFCFGVSRGMDMTLDALAKGEVYTYGPLIHNSEVVNALEKKGAHKIESLDEVELAGKTVIIRSHGVPKAIRDELDEKGAVTIDATCPFVAKIHRIVEADSHKGNVIIIVGNPDHPEIIGIKGWAEGPVYVVENEDDARSLGSFNERPVSVVVQTTFKGNKFLKIVEIIKEKGYYINVYDTICHATKSRQDEASEIAGKVDLMIVIGDRSSSNTLKLFEICRKQCNNAYHIETAKDIRPEWFEGISGVGITAGASTPNYIIEEVQNYVGFKL